MKKTLTRLFTVALLLMVSLGAKADVKVLFGEKGEDTFKSDCGTIEVKQETSKEDATKVTVYLTVTPNKGYAMQEKDVIEAYATAPANIGKTRAPEVSEKITFDCEDFKDEYSTRTYYVDIDPNLALWVKSADFQKKSRDTKNGEEPETTNDGLSGLSFIANYKLEEAASGQTQQYYKEDPSLNYYLCPTDNNYGYYLYENGTNKYSTTNNGQPFLTTYKCRNGEDTRADISEVETNAVWEIKKKKDSDYYYIKHKATGKYLTIHGQLTVPSGFTEVRARLHLEEYSSANDGNMLFDITTIGNNTSIYALAPVNDSSGRSLNPAKGNKNYLYGDPNKTGADGAPKGISIHGIIGLYTATGNGSEGSRWKLESAKCVKPVISFNTLTKELTISTTTIGATIYYTMGDDPANPTSSAYDGTGTNSVTFIITGPTTIKAIAIKDYHYDSDVATKEIIQVATPVIADNGSHAVSITCETEGATIYYTTDGSTPSRNSSEYDAEHPLTDVSNVEIKAIAVKDQYFDSDVVSGTVKLQCAKPVITKVGNTFTITCSYPAGAEIYYSTDGNEPTTSYNGSAVSFADSDLPFTVRAIAQETNYNDSEIGSKYFGVDLSGGGTSDSPYLIRNADDFEVFVDWLNGDSEKRNKYFKIERTNSNNGLINVSGSSGINSDVVFTGTFDGNLITLSGLGHPLFSAMSGSAIVKNVILDNVTISNDNGNAGAICNEASGETRIYNCGVLSTGTTGSSVSGSGHVGSIVGSISGNTRVINCYSYANVKGGTYTAGIVGYNPIATTQENVNTAGMVMNCIFYGDITSGSNISPVYGGELIDNAGENGINNYNYYRRNRYDKETDTYVDDVTFDDSFDDIESYHRSWPADAKYLTRFEYYRSILNSNKKLCTWWVKGTNGTAPTDEDVKDVGIAKWVLDPSIAPYPILKKWGKYPSVINQDPDRRVDPSTKTWENRDDASDDWGKDLAPETEGQKLGTVTVTIDGGTYHSGTKHSTGQTSKPITITAMDKEYNDYCYGKIQLPYYNEIFGDPEGDSWDAKYGGNYTAHVVTGWEISGGSSAVNYNFADRNSYSGRIFAQGGYFYVPKGVTAISITAKWADAVYLCNKDYSIDRVNVAAGLKKADAQRAVAEYGSSFAPAGTIPGTFQNQPVYTTIQDAINNALSATSSGKDVYNQAIVLIGNVQVRNHSYVVGLKKTNAKPFTIMSADLDFDNEPDNCLELQFRNDIDRPGVQPIRFDFLPVPELGLAIRTNKLAYAIGIMIPLGHFEITETAFMRTTQFEYDGVDNNSREGKSPVIINGGEHEMFTVRKHASDRTSYFLLGGNAWIHRFAPGAHPNFNDSPQIFLCPINVIGGEVKELYLSGLYRPGLAIPDKQGNPFCYIDGGKFGTVAGAGYDKVAGSVTFKIDHSLIDEFYGGGINGTNPIGGNIEVTINNSRVEKYCGGPKVGDMTGKTVTTTAKGTTFGVFYGGGNGGNSYYRQLQNDGDQASSHIGTWDDKGYNWDGFSPVLTKYDDGSESETGYTEQQNKTRKVDNKGYHAEYEFEVFNQSNGLSDEITQRGFIHWIQFGITKTGNVVNTLNDCIVEENFFGGGNLATVDGTVTSTLTNTIVKGNAYGAGFSADIPTFKVHNKENKVFPSMDFAGIITDGSVPHASTEYEWTDDLNGMTKSERMASPTYEKDGKWYCFTWNSLDDLGVVKNNVRISLDGNSKVGTMEGEETNQTLKEGTGNVYGGGDASAVNGSTTVILAGNAEVFGNVFGGGNKGIVTGSSKVNIEYEE